MLGSGVALRGEEMQGPAPLCCSITPSGAGYCPRGRFSLRKAMMCSLTELQCLEKVPHVLLLRGEAAAKTGEPALLWSKSIRGDGAAPQGVGAGTQG